MTNKKFDPAGWYSLTDLVERRAFSMFGKDARLYRRIIESDRKAQNILKATIMGAGTRTRYLIQGKNITRFIKAAEAGKLKI